ncbi:hypothetical protein PP572_25565, partial [Mycobacteroides abscessus]|nr:hypothetical protein [Mycobacteroides abscessus]
YLVAHVTEVLDDRMIGKVAVPQLMDGIEVDDEEVELRRAIGCLLFCLESRTACIVARATDNLGIAG